MNHSDQALRALADLIMLYVGRDDIPQTDREGYLCCAETLQKAQRGEITWQQAVERMETNEAAK